MIAIELAARYPSLPKAIVAVDPGPIDPLPRTRSVFEGFIAQLEGPDGEAVRRTWIESDFLATDDADRKRWIVERMCSVPLDVAVAMLRGVIGWNGVGALALCGAPLLVILSSPGGSNDPSRLAAVKPDTRFGMTVGAGHFHQLLVPEQVTPMIEKFVEVAIGE